MKRRPSPEEAAWIESRPPKVRSVIEKLGLSCVRGADGRGHYDITAFSEDADTGEVTLKVVHGSDSFLPGFDVFGMLPDDFVECGCENWEPPTESQRKFAEARARASKGPGNQ
jgi:hypothetical protein